MKTHHKSGFEERKSGARLYRIIRTYTEGRSQAETVRNLLRAHL